MKKMLIVEGIATSGKSSLIKAISDLLGKEKIRIYSESETHMPIIEDVKELHIKFFKNLIEDAKKNEAELVIFDRLHFTQAFRAKADTIRYTEVEDLLLKQDTLVAYLKVDEDAIKERIEFSSQHPRVALSSEHSGESWGQHIKTKGQSIDEVVEYYVDQQNKGMKLLKQSKLKSRIFNTTHHEYQTISNQILNQWLYQV